MAKFEDKISSIINSQLPEFVVSDHPKFAQFLKIYYQFMESAELSVEEVETTDGILLETETNQVNLLLLDGGRLGSNITQLDSGDKVLQEDTAFGKFEIGETVTGAKSKATATIISEDLGNARLFITSQNKFIVGETIDGSKSNARAIVKNYKPNPVTNISELVQFRDPDKVIQNFLTKFRDEFLVTLPENLNTGVDKRTLIKNIKSLYQLKGTAEGHRIFFKLLFNETSETRYPRDNLLKASDGEWGTRKILRAIDVTGDTSKLVGRTITGETSEATAIVENVFRYSFSSFNVSEFVINEDSINGSFDIGETIQGTESEINDTFIKSTVTGIPGSKIITNDGALYDTTSTIALTGGGQGALFNVSSLGAGPLTEIIVDDGGFDFEIGDKIVFTNTGTQGSGAQAFVSVVNGGLAPESGLENGDTLFGANPTSNNPLIKYLAGPVIAYDPNSIQTGYTNADIKGTINDADDATSVALTSIEGLTSGATATVRYNNNGTTLAHFTATRSSAGPDGSLTYDSQTDFERTILYITYTNNILFQKGETIRATAADGSTQFTFKLLPNFGREGVGVNPEGVDETNVADRDSVYQMLRNLGNNTEEDDHIVLEDETSAGDLYAGNKIVQERNTGVGDITDVFTISGGHGYKFLPTLGFTNPDGSKTSAGQDFKLKCFGKDIGRIRDIKTIEHGIQHELSPSPPSIEFVNNSIVRLATGTFVPDETVTGSTSGFTGKVISYDVQRGLLKLKDVVGAPSIGETISGGTSGATALLHISDHASATVNVVAISDTDGAFQNEDGHISENTMKIQDSLFYQDFSYVIRVGESINSWRNSFKKTMHTGGFYFTGEVAITNRLNLKVKSPIVGEASGLVADPVFSIMNTLFNTIFRRRMGTETDGTTLRPNNQLDHDFNSRPNSSTRDTTVKLHHRVSGVLSRIRRQNIGGVNIATGYAYCGPTYNTINKMHNTAFMGDDRQNASGITFEVLNDIRVFGTKTNIDGTPGIFKFTSSAEARRMKTNFALPTVIGTNADLFSNSITRFNNTNLTFDDTDA